LEAAFKPSARRAYHSKRTPSPVGKGGNRPGFLSDRLPPALFPVSLVFLRGQLYLLSGDPILDIGSSSAARLK
jgi:hypothetical protein